MYHFIINPNSRSGKGGLIWNQLEDTLKKQKIEFQAHFTEYRGHAAQISQKLSSTASKEDPVTLIAVGGDGTIQEVLSGVSDLSTILFGYIPTGSGNDFCRSMNIPRDPQKALEQILNCKTHTPMDVPYLSCIPDSGRFAISCGIGFDAAVCHEVSVTPMKKILNRFGLGKLVYLFVALKQILFLKPAPMSIVLDNDQKIEFSKVYFAAVMNQKYEGGGFKFCPAANPSDGFLDVIVIDSLRKLKILLCLPTAFFGKHTRFRGIHILRCTQIHVHSSVPLPIHKDGEASGIGQEISVSVEPKQVTMLL